MGTGKQHIKMPHSDRQCADHDGNVDHQLTVTMLCPAYDKKTQVVLCAEGQINVHPSKMSKVN